MPTYLDSSGNPVSATPPPQATYLDEQGNPLSVADAATARLAARGLTPAAVKAGAGVTTPDQITFQEPPSRFLSGVGSAINPLNLVRMDPVTKTLIALTGHGDMPGQQGIRAAQARGETPGLSDLASGFLQEAGLPDPIGTAKESYHRGEANQTRSDLYGGVAGAAALAGLTHGVTKALPAIAPGLRRAGVAQYADTLAPDESANRPLAESIASRLGDEGVTLQNPKKQIAGVAQQHADAIDTTTPILNRPQAARVGPILSDIEAQRDALFNEVQRVPAPVDPEYRAALIDKLKRPMGEVVQDGDELVVREIAHPDFWNKANELNKLAEHITQSSNRGMIRNDVLAKLTKDYNYVGGTVQGGYQNPGIDPRYLPASTTAADAIRDVVNQDPAAAAANSDKSMWLDAMNKLPKDAQKPVPVAALGDTTRILRKTVLGGAATGAAGLLGGPAAAATTAKVAGVVGGGLELMDMLNRVRENPLYRTTVGGYKMRLAKAIQARDAQGVSDLATPLMTGVGLSDAFGHDAAIHQAVSNAYAQSNGDLNLARQNLFSQEAVYVNPDGSTVPVPQHVTRAFINSVGADSKHANFGMAPSNAQGGQDQTGGATGVRQQTGTPDGGQITSPKRQGTAVEFPASGERDENDALFMKRTAPDGSVAKFPTPVPPSTLLPPQFKNARSVTYGTPIPGTGTMPPEDRGLYGLAFEPSARRQQTAPANTVLVDRSATDEPGTYAHEVNHAVYQKDLQPQQRQQFQQMVVDAINKAAAARQSGGLPAERAVIATIPKAVVAYANAYPQNHDRAFNEMYAELGAQYMLNPTAFKSTYPQWYDLFKQHYGGKEYVQTK